MMSPTMDSALDPLTGQQIGQTDPHFNAVRLYYNLIPVYQGEFNRVKAAYDKAWHDWAVLLLQTAESLNITTRPPGFRAAPTPGTAHKVVLHPDYTVGVIVASVVDTIPPEPDPATQVIQAYYDQASGTQQYRIVALTTAGKGSGGAIVPTTADDIATLVAQLKALSPDQRMSVIAQVLG